MRMMAGLALSVVVLLTGCASSGAGTPSPSPTAPILEGTSWVVTRIATADTLAGKQPTMVFADGRVGGNASCNQYGTDFTQQGTTLTLGANVAQTAMACAPDALMKQEAAFTAALVDVKGVRATDGGAELVDGAGAAVLTLASAPKPTPKPLVGTRWTLSGIVANEAVSSPLAETTVTVTFTDQALSGKACNTFRGPVKVDDQNLSVGPLMSTRMACPSEAEGKQESTVLAILDDVTGYTIEGDTLTLTAPDEKSLIFTAA